jgi:hypothetical protein
MDGITRLPKQPAAGPRLGGSPATSTDTGYPWADGDILYAADLNAAFDRVGENVSHDVGRNLLHNPLFNVAQRGVGPWTTSVYTLDRWFVAATLDTFNISQIALSDGSRTQTGDEATEFALDNVFAGNATAAAYTQLIQKIEDVRRLAGKTITVSFWALAGAAGIKLGVSLTQDFGTGGSPSALVAVNGQAVILTTSFARYSLTFTVPTSAGKTLGTNNNHNTWLQFWYSAGANNAVASGGVGVQSSNVWLWGVQLEIGTQATPLEKPDPQQDLAKCQRFYQVGRCYGGAYGITGQGSSLPYSLPVTMRAVPTVVITSTVGANNMTGIASVGLAPSTAALSFSGIITATGGWYLDATFNASADL